ncbi:ribonuclease H-like domain-containing protein [Patescibacteria group bacterium]|nr:ribonuclease H-like domain-containing protein [Patescibacteria group bacterium]
MRKITFDIETKNSFEEVESTDATKLDISVVCIHDSKTDKYDCFWEEDLDKLWPILEKADMLIGYNSDHFDIPLLNKYYNGDLTQIKSLDILKEIYKKTGRRMKLDNIAEMTLGEKKSGHGMEAITWWKTGEKEKIKKYCLDDVRITKEVYDYAIKNNMLKWKDNGVLKEIKLDTSKWEEKEEKTITNSLF